MRWLERFGVSAYVVLLCLFVLAPLFFVFIASLQHARYMAFPIEEYSLRWYGEALSQPEWRNSLWHSLRLALQATVITTVAGTLAALALHYHEFRGKQTLSLLFLSPLLLPELLIGFALLFYFASLGLSGTYTALVLAHVIITMPFMIRLVLTGLPNVTRDLEEAARTLGANEFRTMMRITLPLVGPAIRGGALFAFMISFNNVYISLFLSTPRITPLPIKIWQHLEFVADPTLAAVSTLFLVMAFGLMWVIERIVKVQLLPTVRS